MLLVSVFPGTGHFYRDFLYFPVGSSHYRGSRFWEYRAIGPPADPLPRKCSELLQGKFELTNFICIPFASLNPSGLAADCRKPQLLHSSVTKRWGLVLCGCRVGTVPWQEP